ncbi:hypothetical protein K443DRAFT_685231 [Laccaria amethystina LaAM-08-1]|uniref:Uncharacterized protein n=1 Tax=Laccaria amethystina LaAM-08-1 TaxID=1095629 RepID=A0A0C9X825_9AGAR|nr:hypothetical protein K443DRAFT_685231 [Laccaria amethystina LaAM-08-1]
MGDKHGLVAGMESSPQEYKNTISSIERTSPLQLLSRKEQANNRQAGLQSAGSPSNPPFFLLPASQLCGPQAQINSRQAEYSRRSRKMTVAPSKPFYSLFALVPYHCAYRNAVGYLEDDT